MPALAATSGVPPAAVIEFDIPAGPLAVTLIEIGRVSGRLVSFPPELVARLVAPSVQGRLTLSQALIPAAQPSGLAVDVTPGGVVTVRGVPVLPATAGDDLCACWMAALPSCRPQTARSNRRIPRTVSGRARPDGRDVQDPHPRPGILHLRGPAAAAGPLPALDLSAGLTVMRANDVLYRYRMPPPTEVEPFEAGSAASPARGLIVLARYRLPDDLLADSRLSLGFRAASSTLVGPPPQYAAPQPEYRLPGGAVLDLWLERVFGPWALNALVNNVFDRRLFSPSSQLTDLPLQPGRRIGLMATYKD